MDVVDKIRKVKTTTTSAANGQPMDDVPVETVIIKSAKQQEGLIRRDLIWYERVGTS